ncbi:hypothetical protein SDC9_158266 [bioreactor metagenome]|uniref:Uncharacterized protein n=1 Tax=bioreactor metagenome TaxID=1076179 RepID=A0A645F9B8_9ZZZZ
MLVKAHEQHGDKVLGAAIGLGDAYIHGKDHGVLVGRGVPDVVANAFHVQPHAFEKFAIALEAGSIVAAVRLDHELLGKALGDLLAAQRGVTVQVALVPVEHGMGQLQIALSFCMHGNEYEKWMAGLALIAVQARAMNFYSG